MSGGVGRHSFPLAARLLDTAMNRFTSTALALAFASITAAANAADDPGRNQAARNLAFQDHIAYVVTFTVPFMSEKCAAIDPGYMAEMAPLYFGFVNSRQDQIERGRMLTVAEVAPDETVRAYRESVVASRLSALDSGTREEKLRICKGALGVLGGMQVPGEWPPQAESAAPAGKAAGR